MNTIELLMKLKPTFSRPVKIVDVSGTQTLGDRAIIYVVSILEEGKFLASTSKPSSYHGEWLKCRVFENRILNEYDIDPEFLQRKIIYLNNVDATDEKGNPVPLPRKGFPVSVCVDPAGNPIFIGSNSIL